MPVEFSNLKSATAEFVGTAFLVASVVGSGIMGQRLSGGDAALTLLVNSVATGAVLLALILSFAPISGAHFNPLVTLAAASQRELPRSRALGFVGVQVLGGLAGVAAANVMFDLPPVFASHHARNGFSQLLAESVATFGLIAVVRLSSSAFAPAGYILGAYWFTSSTSFANPAVTVSRMLTDTFSGIRPADAPAFIVAQSVGCVGAMLFCRWLRASEGKTHAR